MQLVRPNLRYIGIVFGRMGLGGVEDALRIRRPACLKPKRHELETILRSHILKAGAESPGLWLQKILCKEERSVKRNTAGTGKSPGFPLVSSSRILPVGPTVIFARGTVGRVAMAGVPMQTSPAMGLEDCRGTQWLFPPYIFRDFCSTDRTAENGLSRQHLSSTTAFSLCWGEEQSDFEKRVWRMVSDRNRTAYEPDLTSPAQKLQRYSSYDENLLAVPYMPCCGIVFISLRSGTAKNGTRESTTGACLGRSGIKSRPG